MFCSDKNIERLLSAAFCAPAGSKLLSLRFCLFRTAQQSFSESGVSWHHHSPVSRPTESPARRSPEARPWEHTRGGCALSSLLTMSLYQDLCIYFQENIEKGFLLWKAKYFHFLHHISATCDAMRISRVLETSKPCCFSFTTVFKGGYLKLNGNTELLLWAVWELQPYSLLWCRKNTIPVMVLNTADSNATKLRHLMICFFPTAQST